MTSDAMMSKGPVPMETDTIDPWCCTSSTCVKTRRPLLILDIDHTLVHAIHDSEYDQHQQRMQTFGKPLMVDFHIILPGDTGSETYFVSTRPGIHSFLQYAFEHFDVAIWTAAQEEYAHKILTKILSREQFMRLKFVLTNKHCVWNDQKRMFTKPSFQLRDLVPDVDLSNTLLCDDNPYATQPFIENTVLLRPYNCVHQNADLDDEFVLLRNYLDYLWDMRHHAALAISDVRIRHSAMRGSLAWRSLVNFLQYFQSAGVAFQVAYK